MVMVYWQDSPSILMGARMSISRWTSIHQKGADEVSQVKWRLVAVSADDCIVAVMISFKSRFQELWVLFLSQWYQFDQKSGGPCS